MGYEMDEKNFVLMHKEATYQVLAKPSINASINMLKLNRVVKNRKYPLEEDAHQGEEPDIEPMSSVVSAQGGAKPKKKRKAKTQSAREIPKCKDDDNVPDLIMSNMIDVTVQTVDDPDELVHEDEYNRFHVLAMWQHYSVTTIKEEDF